MTCASTPTPTCRTQMQRGPLYGALSCSKRAASDRNARITLRCCEAPCSEVQASRHSLWQRKEHAVRVWIDGHRMSVRARADRGGQFWITVVAASGPDQLVEVQPMTGAITTMIALPGCSGAHGLRLHPDEQSALVACEGNDVLARVDLIGDHAVSIAPTGAGPDALAVDPGLSWLYVAAESGDLTVFDLAQPGLVLVGARRRRPRFRFRSPPGT
jgi:hypothetical protein